MNSQGFTPKEVEKGLHLKLINTLLEINKEKENFYNQIMIDTDGYCLIVNWVERSYNGDFNTRFELLEDDDVVMREVHFPDNHYEYLFPNDVDEILNAWLKEHPNYKQNQYGMWYNENERVAWDTNKIEEQNNWNPNGIEGTSDTTITAKQMSLEDFGIKIE